MPALQWHNLISLNGQQGSKESRVHDLTGDCGEAKHDYHERRDKSPIGIAPTINPSKDHAGHGEQPRADAATPISRVSVPSAGWHGGRFRRCYVEGDLLLLYFADAPVVGKMSRNSVARGRGMMRL
jgi:hypothetical protein